MSPAAALLIDFGGVLTADISAGHRAWCRRSGFPEAALDEVLAQWRADPPEAGNPVLRVESGELAAAGFELLLAGALHARTGKAVRPDGLAAAILASFPRNDALCRFTAGVIASGTPAVVVTNSWGSGRPWEAIGTFRGAVISHETGVRKPDPKIFRIAVDMAGVSAHRCVFLDDLPSNVESARAAGIDGIHHVHTADTVRQLRARFPNVTYDPA